MHHLSPRPGSGKISKAGKSKRDLVSTIVFPGCAQDFISIDLYDLERVVAHSESVVVGPTSPLFRSLIESDAAGITRVSAAYLAALKRVGGKLIR